MEVAEEATQSVAPFAPIPLDGADEMLHLVNQVFFSFKSNAPHVVAFSGIGSEGNSWSVCARTAQLLAQHSSRSVCVVDGNLESMKLTSYYYKDRELPIELKGTDNREGCIPMGNNLWLAGERLVTGGGVGMLPLTELQEKIAVLRTMFQYILIDTPGLKESERASVLTQIAGAVVLVIEANVTRRRDAGKVAHALQAGGVRLLGTILNNRSCPIPKGLYSRL
jgi:Mrp family chromosome partitioning ATPase